MKRVLVAAALAAALLPVHAGADAPDAPRQMSPAAREARQEWAKQYRRLAGHLPVTPLLDAADAAAASMTFDWAELLPAGDLDGDGGEDVADFRVRDSYDDTTGVFSSAAKVEARRGRDGKLLWTTALPGDFSYAFFTKVGAAGKPGMIAVTYEGVYQDALVAGASARTATVSAYDGAGKSVWTYTTNVAGEGSIVNDAYRGMYVADEGDLVPGGGSDLLLNAFTEFGGGDPVGLTGTYAGAVQLQVLDGATGKVRDLGTPLATDVPGTLPAVVGDVTGDKRADVGIAVGAPAGATLHVLSSADGSEAFSTAGLATGQVYYVWRLEDVTGDGTPEVGVVSDVYFEDGATATVVDGKKGTALFAKPGSGLFSIGNADGKRGSEVVTASFLNREGAAGLTVSSYDASGRARWNVTRTLSTAGLDGWSERVSFAPAGDLTNDGVGDIGYSIVVSPMGKNARRDEGTVEGRKGRVLRDPAADMVFARVSFDGHGDDLFTRAVENGRMTVTAWRGEAPVRLWQTVIGVASTDRSQGSFGLRTSRGRCGDLALTVAGARTTSYVLSGKTGAPLWALTRSGSGPGVVTRPKAKSVKRYARGC